MSLRYDEFSALRKRTAPRDAPAKDTKVAKEAPSLASQPNMKPSAVQAIESFEIQLLTSALIVFDFTAALVLMALSCGGDDMHVYMRVLSRVLASFTGFSAFYFFFELLAQIYSFRLSFFLHIGNLLDTAVVVIFLFSDTNAVRVLGVLRFWRIVRLINHIVRQKEREVEQTKDLLNAEKQNVEEAQVEISRLEDSVRREIAAKKKIEAMLKSYKDEVETLNEALKIAALDISTVAGEQLLSDEEDDDDEGVRMPPPKPKGASTAGARGGPAVRKVVIKADGSYTS